MIQNESTFQHWAVNNTSMMPKPSRPSTSDSLLQLNLKDHYEILRDLGRGTYGKLVLAKCMETGTHVALKVLPKNSTKLKEFQREFQYSYFLSPHCNIVDTYNVAFETRSSFVFAQEYAPVGDLFDAIPPQVGMNEKDVKIVVRQVASALEFMNGKQLVHRDIKPENILIFEHDFSKIKLTPKDETVIPIFNEFVSLQRRQTTKIPYQWKRFTPGLLRFFRKKRWTQGQKFAQIIKGLGI